jgi:hypothetical protein
VRLRRSSVSVAATDSNPVQGGTRLSGDYGSSIVELSLAMPFIVTLVLGVADLGRAWQVKNRLTNAARAGVAVAQFTPGLVSPNCNGTSNIRYATVYEDPKLVSDPTFTLTVRLIRGNTRTTLTSCDLTPGQAGDFVEVTVSSRMVIFTPALTALPAYKNGLTITGYAHASVMR